MSDLSMYPALIARKRAPFEPRGLTKIPELTAVRNLQEMEAQSDVPSWLSMVGAE